MTTERNKVLVDASASFKDRYQAMQNYERAVVKNLKPMIGPYGDNETAAQFINGAIKRRTELFGSDVTRNAASASELLDRAMAYRPPTPQQPAAGPGKVQRFIGRANEAIGVARDLVDLAVGGAKKSVDMDSVHSGAANLVRPGGRTGIKEIDASLRSVPVVVNGKIDEGGRVRPMTEADRRDLKSFKDQIGLRQNDKGGDAPRRSNMSNFLATDEVPETLFGIPIVVSPEQYTESDIAFFEEHPRAGGFYELGDEDDEVMEQAGMDVKGTTNTKGTADSFELHKSWSGLTPEQQDMNLRILQRARDFAMHDQNYFKKHGDTLGTYYSEAVGVDALKKIGMQFAPGSWKGQPKCNLLIHNVLESVKRGIAPRFGDRNTGYPWTARSWRMKAPPGFIKVENIDDRVPGDIVVGEVLREDGKLEKHAHIGVVAEDRASSYAAKWDEGAKRYPFPFSDTTSKGKTIKWDPKHTTIIRYIGSPKKGK